MQHAVLLCFSICKMSNICQGCMKHKTQESCITAKCVSYTKYSKRTFDSRAMTQQSQASDAKIVNTEEPKTPRMNHYELLCQRNKDDPKMLAWLKREMYDKKIRWLSEDENGEPRYTVCLCLCGLTHMGYGMCRKGLDTYKYDVLKEPRPRESRHDEDEVVKLFLVAKAKQTAKQESKK